MVTKPADGPYASLYAAKREYEELRRGLSRALAKWTEGSVDFASIFPAIEAFEAAHRHLIGTIYAHGGTLPPGAVAPTPAPVEELAAAVASAPRKARAVKR